MIRICPELWQWEKAFRRLTNFSEQHSCVPPSPPMIPILTGWGFSNDLDKKQRWGETVSWAEKNGCLSLIAEIPDKNFYFVENPTDYTIGPYGNPMYTSWDCSSKICPSPEQIAQLMKTLLSRWSEIVGSRIGSVTTPQKITGRKARRLLVIADATFSPPWGGWSYRSDQDSCRRAFREFRAAVNKAIAPHEVDHIDFTTKLNAY